MESDFKRAGPANGAKTEGLEATGGSVHTAADRSVHKSTVEGIVRLADYMKRVEASKRSPISLRAVALKRYARQRDLYPAKSHAVNEEVDSETVVAGVANDHADHESTHIDGSQVRADNETSHA
jgi:hypothetical protein